MRVTEGEQNWYYGEDRGFTYCSDEASVELDATLRMGGISTEKTSTLDIKTQS